MRVGVIPSFAFVWQAGKATVETIVAFLYPSDLLLDPLALLTLVMTLLNGKQIRCFDRVH